MSILRMQFLFLKDKRVLIREDLNVPVRNGTITSDARIQAAIPTLKLALSAGAKVMVMSHLGRPKEGQYDPAFSLEPVAKRLSELLGQPVRLEKNWLDGVAMASGEVVLCENVRFNPGEGADDETLSRRMADLCDVFVMDAFGTAHRAQASTHGVARFAPVACAGPLLQAELDALGQVLDSPARPLLAIVGGSKVSTKLAVLESLAGKVDQLVVGGGIANTFIAASGYGVGASLFEPELIPVAQKIMQKTQIPLPVDVVVATSVAPDAQTTVKSIDAVAGDEMILDIGPQSAQALEQLIMQTKTLVWNGPVGVFEMAPFASGTRQVAEAIAKSSAFSIAGGGDTIAAIDQFGVQEAVSYISTGGGAFLELLEGKTLPAVAVLQARAAG